MKSITVTSTNISEFYPYQGTTKKISIGDVLEVVNQKVPYPSINGTFAIVTDWLPSDNSQRMIARANDKDAEKYGWKLGAQTTIDCIKEKKEAIWFNRYSINQKYIK